MIPVHIVLGMIGAFILCPLAAFAKKGGTVHRLAGRLLLVDVSLVAISGTLLLLDPLFFLVYWHEQSAPKGFGQYFQSAHYPELFFLWLVVTLLYFSFSGARIWSRVDHGRAERIHSSKVDWVIAMGMGVFGLIFLIIGIMDLIHASKLAGAFIIGSGLLLSFVGFDVYTFLRKPKVQGFPWWILHMTKMFVVWAGLLDAFWLRVRVYLLPEEYINVHYPFGTALWLSFTLIGYIVYRKQFSRKAHNIN